MREILFYRSESGRCPVEEFLDGLTAKQARKVVWVLSIIEEHDSVPSKYFRKLVDTDDLWEVRVDSGSNTFRLLCFYDGPEIVVLTHAFKKKSQKTPRQAIRTAEERMRNHLRRKRP